MTELIPLRLTLLISMLIHAGLITVLTWSSLRSVSIEANLIEVEWVEAAEPRSGLSRMDEANESREKAKIKPVQVIKPKAGVNSATNSEKVQPAQHQLVSGDRSGQLDQYSQAVSRELNRHKRYPEVSIKLRQEGKVLVRFRVDRSGSVLKAEILEHSQHGPLNMAAKKLLEEVNVLPPFPEEIKETTWVFTVPIEYSL